MSRNSSSPTANCTALKKLPALYSKGTMPPPLESPSKMTYFLGCAKPAGGELPQHVGRDGDGLAEHRLSDVDRDVFRRVDRLGKLRRAGRDSLLALRAVAVELKMREMQGQVLGRGDRLERRLEVPRHSEIVAVDMQRVRHAELVHRLLQRFDDLAAASRRRTAPRHRRRTSSCSP